MARLLGGLDETLPLLGLDREALAEGRDGLRVQANALASHLSDEGLTKDCIANDDHRGHNASCQLLCYRNLGLGRQPRDLLLRRRLRLRLRLRGRARGLRVRRCSPQRNCSHRPRRRRGRNEGEGGQRRAAQAQRKRGGAGESCAGEGAATRAARTAAHSGTCCRCHGRRTLQRLGGRACAPAVQDGHCPRVVQGPGPYEDRIGCCLGAT
mmetsp:Transcript_34945/g.89766  ORF Transcript_34945/g.89766 Transcript_34945/m.89766 type:complete len:210 (+) Transcript_34945:356-985(+)